MRFRDFMEDWQTKLVALLLAVLLWLAVRWGSPGSVILPPDRGAPAAVEDAP
jgi:hypothetical protein